MKKTLFTIILSVFTLMAFSQVEGKVFQTFKDTRVINSHSTETLKAWYLDFRVAHRFGDIAGSRGGWQTLYGLESATDILIGFELGLSDRLMAGVNRTKGAGPLKQNVNAFLKYQLFRQTTDGMVPFTVTLVGTGSISTVEPSEDPETIQAFRKFTHRLSYTGHLLIGRKFSERFSLQFGGGVSHRNIVIDNDENTFAFINAATRIQLAKWLGFIAEGTFPFSELRNADNGYFPALGVGFEIETGGGHVYQINLTNATGIAETDYIPYTTSDWSEGQFRLGFTIARLFKI
jgi:hypothetical protein